MLDKYYEKTKSAVASKKELSKEESKVASMPIKMNIVKITRNGKMRINFNQPVVVPFNFIENQGKTKRLLEGDVNSDQPISLKDIDPKELFSIYYLLKSAEDQEDFKYSIILKEWTEHNFAVKVDFVNPLGVSKGLEPDQFYMKIKDPRMIISKETGESILPENLQLLSNLQT